MQDVVFSTICLKDLLRPKSCSQACRWLGAECFLPGIVWLAGEGSVWSSSLLYSFWLSGQGSGDLPCSPLSFMSFDGIHSILFSMENKTNPPPQHKTYAHFHSDVNISLSHTDWFNSTVFSITQCLSAAVPFSLMFRKLKVYRALFSFSPGVFIFFIL